MRVDDAQIEARIGEVAQEPLERPRAAVVVPRGP
jgi:hypothetical protein